MSNLIYQYWNGKMPPAAAVSRELFRAYAKRIGAEYRHDLNANYMGKRSRYFDVLRPILDPEFHRFERVLFVDMDVFPVHLLDVDVFEEPVGDIGLCEEVDQPAHRAIPMVAHITTENDNEWAKQFAPVEFPRDDEGRLRVFNSGVVLLSRRGMKRMREQLWDVEKYNAKVKHLPSFYRWDQHYLHAMIYVLGLDFTLLPGKWNEQIYHYPDGGIYDRRTPQGCFVHVQLRKADQFDEAAIQEIIQR